MALRKYKATWRRHRPLLQVDNNGYPIERLLCKDPNIYYNDLAQWHYHLRPQALGCDGWFMARAPPAENSTPMSKAESCGTGAYIEVVTDKFVAPPMAMKLHESVEALYQA